MATGDQNDMSGRLLAVLPAGWFPATSTPVLDAVLAGCADVWAYCYSMLAYVRLQTRLATATDVWLDVAAVDYFGAALVRFVNETDTAFSLRIRANLLPERGTRAGVIAAVTALVGSAPAVFEPANTGDTGSYGTGNAFVWSGMAYGAAGGWGSLALPFQAFLTVPEPPSGGVPAVNGYGGYAGGYGVGAIEYVTPSMFAGDVTDEAVYQVISDAAPAGSIMWTAITSATRTAPLDEFILDYNVLG